MAKQTECESCLEGGQHTPATTRSTNPDYAGYALCHECADEYDRRTAKRGERTMATCPRCNATFEPQEPTTPVTVSGYYGSYYIGWKQTHARGNQPVRMGPYCDPCILKDLQGELVDTYPD
jgi:hypothetical protein